jgi:glycosyltransferase involved in cell wall biosynthesis
MSIQKDRPLRVLHVGNIANNAYLAALTDREMGIDAFVASPDYEHVMGFPFWEQVEFICETANHFEGTRLENQFTIKSPLWFCTGSWIEIEQKLHLGLVSENLNIDSISTVPIIKDPGSKRFQLSKVVATVYRLFRPIAKKLLPSAAASFLSNTLYYRLRRLSVIDFMKLFSEFDILVFYGPFTSFAAENKLKKPFISFEHGTLRDWIWTSSKYAEKSREGFKRTELLLVTNQDCYAPALSLGISQDRIIKSAHPMNDRHLGEYRRIRREKIERANNSDVIFAPTRHTKSSLVDIGKGNEILIEAIALCKREKMPITFRLTEWGDDVDFTKNLIKKMNLESMVQWGPLLSRPLLKKEISKSFAVVDQFKISAYGAVTCDAIGIGVPVITKQDRNLDINHFGSVAPVMPAGSAAEIYQNLADLLHLTDAQRYILHKESTEWYDNNICDSIVAKTRVAAYQEIINKSELM